MKKFACLLTCFCLACLISPAAFAKEAAVRIAEKSVTLTSTQTSFEITVEVEPENDYAGVEVGIACPVGVAVTASSGSAGRMSASPVLSNGLYWTSFFESDNKLSGTMAITLRLSCQPAFMKGDIRIDNIRVLTKNGGAVVTEKQVPALKISITRAGSPTEETDGTDQPRTEESLTTDYIPPADVLSPGRETAPQTGEYGQRIAALFLLAAGCLATGVLLVFKKTIKK